MQINRPPHSRYPVHFPVLTQFLAPSNSYCRLTYSIAATAAAAARTPTAGPETSLAEAAAVEVVGAAADPVLELLLPPLAAPVEDPIVELAGEPGTP
jgi:hypothetical protein